MEWLGNEALRRLQRLVDEPDLAGTRYQLEGRIGQGGMASVYRARDRELGRHVAIKVLRTEILDAGTQARLRREAQILAQMEHPGIVPVHDVGTLPDGRWFYVMKEVRGKRLDELVKAGTPLTERLFLFRKICETVAFTHARQVIHRDLKPENVMVGEFGEVLVLDWGVAKALEAKEPYAQDLDANDPDAKSVAAQASTAVASTTFSPSPQASSDSHATQHGTIIGTRGYMSPEQERGALDEVDERSDIYALGGILHYLVCGATPGKERANETAVGAPKASAALAAITSKARAPSPSDRYASVVELMSEIDRYLDQRPVRAYPENWWRRGTRLLGRHRTALLLILAYVVVRFVILFWRRI